MCLIFVFDIYKGKGLDNTLSSNHSFKTCDRILSLLKYLPGSKSGVGGVHLYTILLVPRIALIQNVYFSIKYTVITPNGLASIVYD